MLLYRHGPRPVPVMAEMHNADHATRNPLPSSR
jgi:hypothetical protein